MPGPLKLVGSGRHADVYDLGDGRVLRRYRDAAAVAGREAMVMVHALAHGVPVPEVFDVSGADIVMEHAVGPTMLQDVTRRPWTLDRQARLLTALHSMVHAVPALSWLRAPFGDGTVLLHTGTCISFVLAALLIGLTGSLARSVALLAAGPLLALVIVAAGLPETAGRELEQTSAESDGAASVFTGPGAR